MSDVTQRAIPDLLTPVVEAFNQWRGHGRRGRIPNDLWDQATALVDHYPRTVITEALCVSVDALEQQCIKRNLPASKT
ncbi:hypothetical protein HDN1F_01960 [gamma proteobacterium HdN1]|nr:hypothetical protein HDN1F_01960 [gamma proteobacterium HdN1]